MSKADEKYLQLFIRHITTAAANASLYRFDHPQVLNLGLKALDQLKTLFSLTPDINLKIIENRLIYNDQPVERNLSIDRFINSLADLKISYITIEAGTSIEELLTLVEVLNKRNRKDHAPKKTEHIQFGRVEIGRAHV